MKSGFCNIFAVVGVGLALTIGACGNNEAPVQAYALLEGDTYSQSPVKVYVEKSGSIRFAHFADYPDVAYPVYETEVGPYRYYFNVKGAKTVTYCFNY